MRYPGGMVYLRGADGATLFRARVPAVAGVSVTVADAGGTVTHVDVSVGGMDAGHADGPTLAANLWNVPPGPAVMLVCYVVDGRRHEIAKPFEVLATAATAYPPSRGVPGSYRPLPALVGVPEGTALTAAGDVTVAEVGAVVDGKRCGTVRVKAGGVTVQRCDAAGVVIDAGVTGTIIRDSAVGDVSGGGFTLSRCSAGDVSVTGPDVLVEASRATSVRIADAQRVTVTGCEVVSTTFAAVVVAQNADRTVGAISILSNWVSGQRYVGLFTSVPNLPIYGFKVDGNILARQSGTTAAIGVSSQVLLALQYSNNVWEEDGSPATRGVTARPDGTQIQED